MLNIYSSTLVTCGELNGEIEFPPLPLTMKLGKLLADDVVQVAFTVSIGTRIHDHLDFVSPSVLNIAPPARATLKDLRSIALRLFDPSATAIDIKCHRLSHFITSRNAVLRCTLAINFVCTFARNIRRILSRNVVFCFRSCSFFVINIVLTAFNYVLYCSYFAPLEWIYNSPRRLLRAALSLLICNDVSRVLLFLSAGTSARIYSGRA